MFGNGVAIGTAEIIIKTAREIILKESHQAYTMSSGAVRGIPTQQAAGLPTATGPIHSSGTTAAVSGLPRTIKL